MNIKNQIYNCTCGYCGRNIFLNEGIYPLSCPICNKEFKLENKIKRKEQREQLWKRIRKYFFP